MVTSREKQLTAHSYNVLTFWVAFFAFVVAVTMWATMFMFFNLDAGRKDVIGGMIAQSVLGLPMIAVLPGKNSVVGDSSLTVQSVQESFHSGDIFLFGQNPGKRLSSAISVVPTDPNVGNAEFAAMKYFSNREEYKTLVILSADVLVLPNWWKKLQVRCLGPFYPCFAFFLVTPSSTEGRTVLIYFFRTTMKHHNKAAIHL